MIYFLITVFLTLSMTFLSRMHGGGTWDSPIVNFINKYSLEAFIMSAPLAVLTVIATTGWWQLLALPVFGLSVLGLRTGHGQYMDLGRWKKKIKPEKLDPIVRLFFGEDPNVKTEGSGNYWRDFFGLFVTGFICTVLPTIILLLTGHILAGIAIALAGGLKCLAYAITAPDTENAEYLRGVFLGLGYSITFLELLS